MKKIKFENLPTYKLKTEFGDYEVKVIGNKYYNNKTLAIMLVEAETGECFADLTVNIDGVAGGNFAYVDTNNNDWAVKFIEENKLGINTGAVGFSGFCSYPLFAFDEDKIIQEENIDFGGEEND